MRVELLLATGCDEHLSPSHPAACRPGRFAFGDRMGGLDFSRPQVHTITFSGSRRVVDAVSFSLESLTMAGKALFRIDVLERAGAKSFPVRCGNDDIGVGYIQLWAFDWPGRGRAWFSTQEQGGSGGVSGDVTFYLVDPSEIYRRMIPESNCPAPPDP